MAVFTFVTRRLAVRLARLAGGSLTVFKRDPRGAMLMKTGAKLRRVRVADAWGYSLCGYNDDGKDVTDALTSVGGGFVKSDGTLLVADVVKPEPTGGVRDTHRDVPVSQQCSR